MELFLLPLILDPLAHLDRFPPHATAHNQALYHERHLHYLRSLRCLDPYRVDPPIAETERRLHLWRLLAGASASWDDCGSRRARLRFLRGLLGEPCYQRGEMPPELPAGHEPPVLWREPEAVRNANDRP